MGGLTLAAEQANENQPRDPGDGYSGETEKSDEEEFQRKIRHGSILPRGPNRFEPHPGRLRREGERCEDKRRYSEDQNRARGTCRHPDHIAVGLLNGQLDAERQDRDQTENDGQIDQVVVRVDEDSDGHASDNRDKPDRYYALKKEGHPPILPDSMAADPLEDNTWRSCWY